ncbi:unnamed protein product [Cuscuta europaea]|uniref:Uncharacterized protein n=1 Tax=Cuscuta europaea TaxID=41803 RepID=A0A9P1E7N1_CUSEU|nr:unnamed protein product [Cuscuta europaea]
MALETWLIKVRHIVAHSLDVIRAAATPRPTTKPLPLPLVQTATKAATGAHVGVLAFEISGVMSKLLHLWNSLSDNNITRIQVESVATLEGVRKIVSDDDAFLLVMACSELVDNLKTVAESVSRISNRCHNDNDDSNLLSSSFDSLLSEFADSGQDPNGFVLSWKDMESRMKKLERYVSSTALLRRAMDELIGLQNRLRKTSEAKDLDSSMGEKRLSDLQQKLHWQKKQIKYLKQNSLWSRSFESVSILLARCIFTTVARIKLVFVGINENLDRRYLTLPGSTMPHKVEIPDLARSAFFVSNSDTLKPPEGTLGAAALSLHYANLIVIMEKMIRSPQLIGFDARADLYSMLPNSIRSSLRTRLKGVGFSAATDQGLAGEWREALQKILGWISPLAHNMIKWQSERSFEHHNLLPKTNVLLIQTLFYANQEKTEAAITELLVGLNYIWRFEREKINAYECTKFNTIFQESN